MAIAKVLQSINPNTAPPARRKSVVVLEEREPSLWNSLVQMEEVQWNQLCGLKTVSVTRITNARGILQLLSPK